MGEIKFECGNVKYEKVAELIYDMMYAYLSEHRSVLLKKIFYENKSDNTVPRVYDDFEKASDIIDEIILDINDNRKDEIIKYLATIVSDNDKRAKP